MSAEYLSEGGEKMGDERQGQDEELSSFDLMIEGGKLLTQGDPRGHEYIQKARQQDPKLAEKLASQLPSNPSRMTRSSAELEKIHGPEGPHYNDYGPEVRNHPGGGKNE